MTIQMYKENIMLKDFYNEALLEQDKEKFSIAQGIAVVLLDRNSRIPDITKHPAFPCHNAMVRINRTMAGLWYEVIIEDKEMSIYYDQQLDQMTKDIVLCLKAAVDTGLFTEENLSIPLPSISPANTDF